MSVKLIVRKLDFSPNTVYKYINFVDMDVDIKKNKNFQEKILPYKSTIISYYQEDKIHHVKQRHTYKRIYKRLKEEFPDFNCSYSMTRNFCAQIKTAVYAFNEGYLFLDHKAGTAQINFGDCSFYENDQRIEGKYCVMAFPYSNASYYQIMYNRTAESIVEAIRNIFEYIHGVPHTIGFDNDTSLVSMRYGPNNKVIRTLCNIFKRFYLAL